MTVSAVSPADSAAFRRVMGRIPTSVTVVTSLADGDVIKPVGMTIGSFVSVSLDPPLVGFLPQKTSTTWATIEQSGIFCVNVLADTQSDLCWQFAKSSGSFDDVMWSPTLLSGAPLLDGAVAWIDCRIAQVIDAGDHWFVLGEVVGMNATDDGQPLVFSNGALGTVRPLSA
jgi:3-hydroxy-9,10-secoandrosta-1,3,5(10)-triene-9,17-dione monooxygenase reductase component